MNGRRPTKKNTRGGHIKSPVENFMNGLDGGTASATGNSDDPDPNSKVASQIRRYGLQADG